MKFRTEIEIKPFAEKIDYKSKIFSVGSCFAQYMAEEFRNAKFDILSNPTGILFNPSSIKAVIHRCAEHKHLTLNELQCNNGRWFCYDLHSSFSGADPEALLADANTAIEQGAKALAEADWVIITFGTAWVYTLNESEKIVANCHKQPASNFTRRRLSTDEIIGMYDRLLRSVLADKKVIFTVSPVRHLGDGAEENFLSKAILKVAVAEIVERFDNAYYFPAYEILNDDLRDYRFYGEDMCHPTVQARKYIREKFFEATLSEQTLKALPQIEKIQQALSHKPFDKESEAYLNFCRQQLDKIERIPEVDFDSARRYFEQEIENWHNNKQ